MEVLEAIKSRRSIRRYKTDQIDDKKIELPNKKIPNPAANAMNTVPVIIAVCAEIGKAGAKHGPGGGGVEYATDKGDWFMFDTALAVQNMVLAAHAQGLGTG